MRQVKGVQDRYHEQVQGVQGRHKGYCVNEPVCVILTLLDIFKSVVSTSLIHCKCHWVDVLLYHPGHSKNTG